MTRKKTGFIVALIVLVSGLIFEYLYPLGTIPPLRFPNSLYISLALINVILFLFFAYKQNTSIKWLGSIPAAISSISLLVCLTLLMGLIQQDMPEANHHSFGLHHIKNTWYLAFSLIYILISLGITILSHLIKRREGNLGFALNHIGLWIVLFAAFAGNQDLERHEIQLQEGQIQQHSTDQKPLPCSIALTDFKLEKYPPELQLIKRHSNAILKTTIDTTLTQQVLHLDTYHITLSKVLTSAHIDGATYHSDKRPGSVFAAYAIVNNEHQQELLSAWLSSASFRYRSQEVFIDKDTKLRLSTPEARRFASTVIFNQKDTATIEVNHPVSYAKHTFYQNSYNAAMGKWSQTSYLEMVYDPWLPIVYIGIIMLIIGSFFMLWKANKNKRYD